jgi:hypothetical protein
MYVRQKWILIREAKRRMKTSRMRFLKALMLRVTVVGKMRNEHIRDSSETENIVTWPNSIIRDVIRGWAVTQ